MIYSGTDPESYITECTLVYEDNFFVPEGFRGPLLSEEGTPSMVLKTFVLKMAQAKARIWPSRRPDSGLDCLICAKFVRPR